MVQALTQAVEEWLFFLIINQVLKGRIPEPVFLDTCVRGYLCSIIPISESGALSYATSLEMWAVFVQVLGVGGGVAAQDFSLVADLARQLDAGGSLQALLQSLLSNKRPLALMPDIKVLLCISRLGPSRVPARQRT